MNIIIEREVIARGKVTAFIVLLALYCNSDLWWTDLLTNNDFMEVAKLPLSKHYSVFAHANCNRLMGEVDFSVVACDLARAVRMVG